MKRIFCVLMAMILLSGCALTTIRPPKRAVRKKAKPPTVVERIKKVFTPKPEPEVVAVEEKEEILPLRVEEEKEEIK